MSALASPSEMPWSQLYRSLESFVHPRVNDPEAARDLIQDVVLKMLLHLPKLQSEAKLFPWMYQIARNAIIDHYRQQTSHPSLAESAVLSEEAEPSLTHEFALCMVPMIQTLPPKYREALILTEIEGLSQKALAQRLGISYPGAKSRVQRGRQLLKSALIECCTIETDCYGNITDYHPNV